MTRLTLFIQQIEEVELIERRGYLTLRLSLPKEGGKLLLRKTDGIRKWYLTLQVRVFKAIKTHYQALCCQRFHD